jgi:hypothetical protein
MEITKDGIKYLIHLNHNLSLIQYHNYQFFFDPHTTLPIIHPKPSKGIRVVTLPMEKAWIVANMLPAHTLPIIDCHKAAREPLTGPKAENPNAAARGFIAAPIEARTDENQPMKL